MTRPAPSRLEPFRSRNARRYGALGFATACWGTAATATKLGLGAFRPATQLLVELVFATGLLW
ncbi:MAG TPA: hypothetical protein VMS02_08255, partial [Solirubrobacteraceae bacterium]|nr:hypothetical protein [Solirubrobacteraceae bacterium]